MKRIPLIKKEDVEAASKTPGKMDVVSNSQLAIRHYYNDRLCAVLKANPPRTDCCETIPFLYSVPAGKAERRPLGDRLDILGIDTGIHQRQRYWFSSFKECGNGYLPVAEQAGRELLTLPLHSMMSADNALRVASGVALCFSGKQDE